MPVHLIPNGQRMWQAIASAYRPPNAPFALYAEDERIGHYHAGTLGINFATGVNTLSLHNAWLAGDWFGAYPLRIPEEGRAATFPRMVTPQEAARGIGYSLDTGAVQLPEIVPNEPDAPAWVKAYWGYLQNQVDLYGSVVRRETRPSFL